MSYLDAFELGTNNLEFRNRCMMALLDVSVEVLAENSALDGHTYRAAMATAIMANAMNSANSMAIAAAASGTLTSVSTDAEIRTALVNAWSTYSGVPVIVIP